MNGEEVASVLAVLSAAFWNGRPIPPEAVALYTQHLRPLDVRDVGPAVSEIIDTNTTGFYPAVGAIVDRARAFEESRRLSEHPAPRSIEAKVAWLRGAPWFVRLQMARMTREQPAGYPLKELAAGGKDELLAECARFGVDVTEQEMIRWPK